MKLGTLTNFNALKKMQFAFSVYCDQLGEYVSICDDVAEIKIFSLSSPDDVYVFVKRQNAIVDVFQGKNGKAFHQYIRMYTEDGDKMDFVLVEPAPAITVQELLHPVS